MFFSAKQKRYHLVCASVKVTAYKLINEMTIFYFMYESCKNNLTDNEKEVTSAENVLLIQLVVEVKSKKCILQKKMTDIIIK